MIKIYVKKKKASFNAILTIAVLNEDGSVNEEKSLRDIACRSGKWNWERNPKITGDDPVPDGKMYLWNKRGYIQQYNDLDAVGGEIGRFYPISDNLTNHRLISHKTTPSTKKSRWDIGLHDENSFPGSSGCIVVIDNKDFRKVCKLLEQFEGEIIPINIWTE